MRKLFTLIVLLLGAGLFVEASYSPIYRLRGNMPAQFVDDASDWPPQKRDAETRIAKAYWACAVGEVQWRYGYGYRLPQDPPADFTIGEENFGSLPEASAARERYWTKLQRAWYVPDNWNKRYQWDTRWMTDWLDTMKRLVHAS